MRRKEGERFNKDCVVGTVAHKGGSVHVIHHAIHY